MEQIEVDGYEVFEEGLSVGKFDGRRCICGNTDELEGWRQFDAKTEACNRCGRVVDAKGKVVGETSPARGLNG